MPMISLADLERRLRRLEMERDQNRNKFVAPDRSVTEAPPLTRAIDHGALTGLSDNDHPQYLLAASGKAADSDKLDGLDSTDFGRPVFLTTPLTSTAWDGDSFSTTGKTLIDLSSVFGVPAGVKAVLVRMIARDSGSSSGYNQLMLSPNSTAGSAAVQCYLQGTTPLAETYTSFGMPCK